MSKDFIFVNAGGDYEEAIGYETSDFINSSAGAGDAGKPIVLDAAGHIDASMINDADIDHGGLTGLADDDHTQYILVAGTRAFSGDQSMGSNQLTSVGDPTATTIDSASNDAVPMSFLASSSSGEGAALIGIQDASSYYAGNSVEAVSNELEAQIGGATSSTYAFAEDNVLADNDAIYAALNKLDLKWGDIESTANGEGASIVAIEDAGSYFSSANVEGALQELGASIIESGVSYTAGTGGVTKGDLVYISANDTVLPSDNSQSNCPGLAASTIAAASPVTVLANDTVLTSVLTTAIAGDKYYWSGSAHSTTIPTGTGAYVWKTGFAKNATDLHVEVRLVKKNN